LSIDELAPAIAQPPSATIGDVTAKVASTVVAGVVCWFTGAFDAEELVLLGKAEAGCVRLSNGERGLRAVEVGLLPREPGCIVLRCDANSCERTSDSSIPPPPEEEVAGAVVCEVDMMGWGKCRTGGIEGDKSYVMLASSNMARWPEKAIHLSAEDIQLQLQIQQKRCKQARCIPPRRFLRAAQSSLMLLPRPCVRLGVPLVTVITVQFKISWNPVGIENRIPKLNVQKKIGSVPKYFFGNKP
jgi:hypothetical protein